MSKEIAEAVLKQKMMLIETLGMFGLKTLLTLNSGATVVLLALLGSLQDGPAALAVDVGQLQSAMMCFFVGVFFVMISIAVTYIGAGKAVASWPQPPRLTTGQHMFRMLAPAFLSFLAFGYGFFKATYAFSPAG